MVVVGTGDGTKGGRVRTRVKDTGGGLDHSTKDRNVMVKLLVRLVDVTGWSTVTAGRFGFVKRVLEHGVGNACTGESGALPRE